MPACSVASCHNWNGITKNKNVKYFQFPKEEVLRQIWIDACNSEKPINLKNGRICSIHFTSEYYRDTSHLNIGREKPILKLKSDAVPILNLTKTNDSPCKETPGRKCKISDQIQNKSPSLLKVAKSLNSSKNYLTFSNVLNNITNRGHSNLSTCHSRSQPVEVRSSGSQQSTSTSFIDESSYERNDNISSADPTESNGNASSELSQKKIFSNTEHENHEQQTVQVEIEQLKLKNQHLETQLLKKEIEERKNNKSMQKQIQNKIHEILSPIFTPGQIRKLLHPKQKYVKWSEEDISSAIAFRSVTAKGYRYLREKGYPLPAFSTLRKGAAIMNIEGVRSMKATNVNNRRIKSLMKIARHSNF